MKPALSSLLLLPLLASCGSAAPETQFTPQQTRSTLAGEWTADVQQAALRLTLTQEGGQVRGQAELPALAWNEAGTFEVQGRQSGPQFGAQLLRGGREVYDLSCERSAANVWTCALRTQTGGERLSSAWVSRLTLTPVN
ncbi:hypothetical protein ACTQ9L_09890 [Deinococcus wulumuqiensis]|uniref:hypothetical protein n=1 Tax=Deinococcus wulumuqiensis TaxID=980427 RepID=UPI00242BF26A|nr:hypothetical protein [Deinococcus wulumuqiensis]